MSLTAAELKATYAVDESELDKSIKGIPGKIKASAAALAGAGLIIGGALGGGLMSGMENERVNDKLAAQIGLTAPESARIGGVAGQLYADAYGDSLGGVNDAVGAVMSSIGGMSSASSADLEAMTAKALDFATAFEVDVTRSTQIAGQMITQGLAKDGTEAFDLLVSASQQVPAAIREDLLDATDEYGGFFADLGYTGPQAMALLVDASEKGMYGIDKLGDSMKEFLILATTDLARTGPVYEQLGMDADEMSNRLLAGGASAQSATQEIIAGLLGIEDPSARAKAAVDMFGTPLEDLSVQEIPAFLEALQMSKGELENVAGAADRMGETLNDNASSNIESFKRKATQAFVNILGGQVLPIVKDVGEWLQDNFGPALIAVKDILVNDVGPALKDMKKWIEDNETPIKVVSGLIAALFIPHLIALAAQSVVTAATSAASWIVIKAQAIGAAVVHSAQILMMIGRWVALAASAVVNAAIVVAAQVGMAVSAVVQAAIVAAAWLGAQIRTVASLVVMAAGFVAQGAVMVASAAATAAGVVASWVLMGAQAMANAVRMAAAWVIAMGPVGWAIALIIGLVALIALNWDKVKEYTRAAWDWVSDKVSGAWRWIKDSVSSGVSNVVDFVKGLPGRILGALGDFGSLLLDAGKDLLTGLWNGIKNAGSWLLGKVGSFFGSLLPGWVRDMLGIHSPSTVFAEMGRYLILGMAAGIDGEAKTAVNAAARAAAAITDAMQVTAPDLMGLANQQAMAGLTVRRPAGVTAPGGAATGVAAQSDAGAAGGVNGPLLNIEEYYEQPGSSPAATASALGVEVRTRPWT